MSTSSKTPLLTLILASASFLFMMGGCKDACEKAKVSCAIGGEAKVWKEDHCICDCRTGYEGEFCKQVVRNKYIGTYTGSYSCLTGDNEDYKVEIEYNENGIIWVNIKNLYNKGFAAYASVDSIGNLRIPSQPYGRGRIHGTATTDGQNLTVDFAVTSEGGKTDDCQGNFGKE